MLLPGACLGVLGGGQLGRMFCVAARTMGYTTVVLDPDSGSPAGRIADRHIQAAYTDTQALDQLLELCDVITTEFENVPAQSLTYLAKKKPVYPTAENVEIAQNRVREKNFAQNAGVEPAPFAAVSSEAELIAALVKVGTPAILKTATMGYDGKGQFVVENQQQALEAFRSINGIACVLEQKLTLKQEISVLLARNAKGEVACYLPAENEHRNGILHQSIVPARVSKELAEQAIGKAQALAEAMTYVGVLAVEFFITDDNRLIFNEMAPRPHNSGHYTKDAAVTSQFEQQVRVMCGLKPGDTRLISPVVMVNLLGDLWHPDWAHLFNEPGAKLHLYGKAEARPGRKMGHYNVLAESAGQAKLIADRIFDRLAAE
ncbi:MAG: 5-(carboxyamino)imidazole ribonucleotide synthase [Gammaproteobacteria bacterium]|nr:5-(carboxyamino)imidazole ribonucleotide synthase [Gammaproteobacteria bacterium]